MAEKSWQDKLRVDTGPMEARASKDGDRMYAAIGRYLNHAMFGTPLEADKPVVVPEAPVRTTQWIPTDMPFMGLKPEGPVPPSPMIGVAGQPATAGSPKAGSIPKGAKIALAAKAAPEQPVDMSQLPKFDISDLLPNQEKLKAALDAANVVDTRPLAALMDSVYGTNTYAKTPDQHAEMLQKIKAVQDMSGYSPALQQVIGQGRLEEYKSKLSELVGSKDKALDRAYKERALSLQEQIAQDASARGWAQIQLEKLKNTAKGAALPKDTEKMLEKIQEKLAGNTPIRSELMAAYQKLNDPDVSDAEKIRIGELLPKSLNSLQGADAAGVEEAQKAIGELYTSLGKIGKATAYGLGAGAAIGAAPTLGLGAPAGAMIGGGVGLAGSLFDEMSRPSGVRLTPDVKGFTNKVQLQLQKIDSLMKRQELLVSMIKQGHSITDANTLIDGLMK